jgi:hypothetical protein
VPPPNVGQPGVWETFGPAPVASPRWGYVKPWVLSSASQFRPEAPPELTSETYTRDYDEVKALARMTNSARTPEQTQIAIFWDGTPAAIWNSVARGVITARGLTAADAARTFALMYLAAADASIACFEARYVYHFWRPISAICRADEDR